MVIQNLQEDPEWKLLIPMNKILPALLCICLLLLLLNPLWAQKLEAEEATLSNGAAIQECTSCSGGQMVAQGEGTLSFSISIPEEAFYNIYLRAASPSGNKTNKFSINGNSLDFTLSQNSQYTTHKLISAQKLPAGQLQAQILKSWGWVNIDYIEFESVDGTNRFSLNQTLVTANPTPEATALYDFLLDNYGRKVISGVMTLSSMDEAIWLKENTGKEPALLGIDFMHSGRGYTWYDDETPMRDAAAWYNRNGIPAMMWHWRDPSRQTEEFYTKSSSKPEGTAFDLSKIFDESSAEYTALLRDIDYIAALLKALQDQQVPVIWRPLHEAAGGWFWWGAKGPEPLKALWHLMYDRMVNHHGLTNLIWVWTREPNDDSWYPGDAYVDLIGRDIYKDGDHSSQTLEFSDMNNRYGGEKMLALTETGSFPDADKLVQDGATWSWYMPWYGAYTRDSRYNSLDLWKKMFAHDYVITLDEMPQLRTYERQDPGTEPEVPTGLWGPSMVAAGFIAYPSLVKDNITLSSQSKLKTITVYNMLGVLMKTEQVAGNKAVISLAQLPPGVYVLRVDQKGIRKIVKE